MLDTQTDEIRLDALGVDGQVVEPTACERAVVVTVVDADDDLVLLTGSPEAVQRIARSMRPAAPNRKAKRKAQRQARRRNR